MDDSRFSRSHRRRPPDGAHPPPVPRALLDQNEVNILRGVLTAVQARRRPRQEA